MRTWRRTAVAVVVVLVAAGCGGGASQGDASQGESSADEPRGREAFDYAALGLWDDGPCDAANEPLRLGFIGTLESSVISLKAFATALEASAAAFNDRGGANGSCIEVTICDDEASEDEAVACVRTLDEAGVVATVNDQGTAGAADVSAMMAERGIPRVAGNVTPSDWADPNAYPIDAGGTGATFMVPQGLLEEGAKQLALVRVDLAQASAMVGFLDSIYGDDGVTFPVDLPVAAGTTDYSQFVIRAEQAEVDAIALALGPQEAAQVAQAAGQMASDLPLGTGFPHSRMTKLGDVAENVVMVSPMPPATSMDVPVYDVIRADLAAAGDPEVAPENLDSFGYRPWIGLYALLTMMRDAQMTSFSGEAITAMLQVAEDVPMLGMFGGEDWTPDTDHPGLFKRAGMNHWAVYRWDPDADAPDGLEGNFVRTGEFRFDDVLCGSPLGAPEPCPPTE